MYTLNLAADHPHYLYSLGMAWAAVLRTYGDMSEAASLMANIMMGTIMGTRMLDSTRRALARISWLGSYGDMWAVQCSCGRLSAPPDLPCILKPAHLESSLEGRDGEQGQILLLLCIAHQVHVHQLLHLQGEGAISEPPRLQPVSKNRESDRPQDAARATQDLPHLNVLAGNIFHHSWEEIRGVFTTGNHLGGKEAV